jgi:Secretion system C-terminal sorting domain/Immune inhibitor A-like, MAM domain
MKKLLTVLLVVIVASGLFANEVVRVKNINPTLFSRQNSQMRDFITITEEDFEGGIGDWEYYDETAPTDWNEEWHLSTVGAYEGQSWWMGDEDLGGYTDHRYLVLDTPTLTLAASNPELNFMFALGCEDTGGDPPYNAWDGANVRISTDGGTTWTPIEGTPEYNGSSFYSFGYEFNEGVNIPGWGSTTLWVEWTAATFDLSAYAGDDVKIRFAFASDPAYNTADDDSMFGFKLDDIEVDTDDGLFVSDGDGAAGDDEMAPGYGGAVVGNLWHVYDDAMAPSPVNAVGCFDEGTGTYLPGMSNFVVSPAFTLPADGIFTWDVYCQTLLDAGTFPDCDYIHVEVRSMLPGEAWSGWNSISNPLGDPGGTNYVFTGAVDTWTLFTEGWGVEYASITMLAGRDVQFRFGMHSNTTDEVVPGGFRIDNFYVMQEVYLGPAPENLMADVTVDDQVVLTWDPISEGGEEGWLQWDDGTNNDAIGLTNGGTMYCAASFDQSDLMAYVGGQFTEVELYINDVPSSMILHIWEGANAGTEVLSQTFTATGADWVTVELDTPVTIAGSTEYWVGYEVTHAAAEFSCGTDAGPAIVGKGDWIATSPGAWQSMAGLGLDYNWNIHAYVDGGRVMTNNTTTLDRNVTGYNIKHSLESGGDYTLIGTVDPSDNPTFTDETPEAGAWNYYVVTALYDGLDGAASNEAMAYIFDEDAIELAYDDGTAEEGLNVGIAQYMAVKFTPDYPSSRILTHIKMYIEEMNTGQFVFRVFPDDGGMPGATQLAQFNITPDNLHVGWNTIVVPDPLTFNSGSFYVAVFEMANLASLGLDTDNMGQSWKTVANQWQEVTEGNIMIRAIILPGDSETPEEIAPANAAVSNYPNPFNPETTIAMNIPADGYASLKVYNVKGQLVNTLVDGFMTAGENFVTWNGTDDNSNPVTSGIYFYKLETGSQTVTSKMIMLK